MVNMRKQFSVIISIFVATCFVNKLKAMYLCSKIRDLCKSYSYDEMVITLIFSLDQFT